MPSHLRIIGGGPSGLRAAEIAAEAGVRVTIHDAMPSVGRKFLIAGRGGLNLTHSESRETFAKRYSGSLGNDRWSSLLEDFDNQSIRNWAHSLGIDTFIGTSGRIFPREKKAAPLLRAWLQRLRHLGVEIRTRSKLLSWEAGEGRYIVSFQEKDTRIQSDADAMILALGGASWPQTGSDGTWATLLRSKGCSLSPFQPANCGWECDWAPDFLEKSEGLPLKNLSVSVDQKHVKGELLITRYGLEGGTLYQLGPLLRRREGPEISVDFKPEISLDELLLKSHRTDCLKAWRLSPTAIRMITLFLKGKPPATPEQLARLVKGFRIPLLRPRPIAEAISSAGGIDGSELTEDLMLIRSPGIFLAGEMIDWEAPTGGYLLQGCFATGTRSARGALAYLKAKGKIR